MQENLGSLSAMGLNRGVYRYLPVWGCRQLGCRSVHSLSRPTPTRGLAHLWKQEEVDQLIKFIEIMEIAARIPGSQSMQGTRSSWCSVAVSR